MFLHNKQIEELQGAVAHLTNQVVRLATALDHTHHVAVRTETRVCRIATHLNAPFQPDPAKYSKPPTSVKFDSKYPSKEQS